jgi:hypothetical protein
MVITTPLSPIIVVHPGARCWKALWHLAKTPVPADPEKALKFNFGTLDLSKEGMHSCKP